MRRLLALLFLPLSAFATNYTVKSSGGSFTTISACAGTAVAGDTCTVYASASPQSGWTQTTNGTAGNPITFTVNPGDAVTITSTITVTNTSYITIGAPDAGGGCAANGRTTGGGGANPSFVVGGCFTFQNAGVQGPTCGSGNHTNHLHLTYNTSRGTSPANFIALAQGGVVGGGCQPYVDTRSSNNYVGHNDINWTIDTTGVICTQPILIYGDNNLVEYNDSAGTGHQHIRMGGNFNVIRDNYAHDDNGSTLECGGPGSPDHIDFYFGEGGDEPAFSFSLIERNVWKNCSNDQGNCKFNFSRGSSGGAAIDTSNTGISRYNYVQNTDDSFGGAGDHNDGATTTPNWHAYNNTIATGSLGSSSGKCGNWDSGVAAEFNMICYNTTANTWSPFFLGTSGSTDNGNLAYNTVCTTTCTWSGGDTHYINEGTYSALHNQNPTFANYPTDGTIQSSSVAHGGGVAFTTVSSGCNSTSLTVADASFFQPGWGPTDKAVGGDTIRVGASATAQVTAVDYTNNILTLGSSISCTNGNSVYLYKDSAGTVVLTGASPDVGAFPFVASGSTAGSQLSGGVTMSGGTVLQ